MAYADAFMKGSLQFEGPNTAGSEGYSSGFGLIAIPSVAEVDLKGEIASHRLSISKPHDWAHNRVSLYGIPFEFATSL